MASGCWPSASTGNMFFSLAQLYCACSRLACLVGISREFIAIRWIKWRWTRARRHCAMPNLCHRGTNEAHTMLGETTSAAKHREFALAELSLAGSVSKCPWFVIILNTCFPISIFISHIKWLEGSQAKAGLWKNRWGFKRMTKRCWKHRENQTTEVPVLVQKWWTFFFLFTALRARNNHRNQRIACRQTTADTLLHAIPFLAR